MSSGSPTNLPPAFRLNQMIMSLWVPQVVHAAAELGVADVLAEGPLPSSKVAARLGTHPDATERLLRTLVTLDLLAPRGERFELTEMGRCLETSSPTSRRAWSRLMGGPGVWKAWGCLTECVRTGQMAWGGGAAAPSGTEHFDEMARDPAAAAIFHQAMVELTRGAAPGIVGAVDLRGARRVADVGGGHGALLCAILEAHPGVEGVVFDLEHARRGALELFASRGVAARASFVAGSCFDTAPPAADVYVLKSVIHDWDDARSLQILGKCREAMDGAARLLVVEAPAPAPAAAAQRGNPALDWVLAFSDINMLVNTGGRERTEAEYRALLEAAGLRVARVLETPSFYRVFEATRA
ncbi:methyltransferase [Sorangium sp. So ce260]|uniref:methyltransferase n=1 Tax=Sorangium sp. So ce260 TaxID=3133291 RepID=UPI003F5ED28E